MSERSEGGTNRVYLLLGSNIDPERNLPAAVERLTRFGQLVRASRVWESPPVDRTDQPNYLNAAVLLETALSATEICDTVVVSVEQSLHRVRDRRNKFGPRTIDVDLCLFNEEVIRIGHRRIPDPDIYERPFVGIPLAEIAPDYVHPETGETLRQIAQRQRPAAGGLQLRSDVTATVRQMLNDLA